jgi:hypothetical protein
MDYLLCKKGEIVDSILVAYARTLFFTWARLFFQQHSQLPASPCHTYATDWNYTNLYISYIHNSLLCDLSSSYVQIEVCLYIVKSFKENAQETLLLWRVH